MSGPIQGDQIDHWPNCPNTPKLAAEPPACRICGKAPAWNGGDWCRDCSRGKGEPQSEPLKWNSEGLAEAPGMRYCTMYGSMFLYIDGKSQGVLISTASDEASRRKAAEEDFRSRMVPQSEPPIADGVGVGIANLFMGHEAETAGKVLARAYLSLKAERDALRAENAAKYEEIASERHSYILLEAERQRLYDGNAALRAQLRTTMTDPKPAPPATDDCICEDVRVLGACPVHEPRSTEPANDDLVAAWLADLQGMDDADREHDVTVLDTRSLLYRIAADAETIRKQAQEIKRLTSNVERLEGDGRFVAFELSDELATLREQVRTLREALKAALGHCDCSDYRGMALIPCTAANPCAGCYTTRTGQAALAATEPKG